MCQQVETILPEPFPDGSWEGGKDENSFIVPESPMWFGIDMSQDRKYTVIAVCGMREDGNYHVEIVDRRIGSEWAVDWFRARVGKYGGMNLAFQGRGAPVSGLAVADVDLQRELRDAVRQEVDDGLQIILRLIKLLCCVVQHLR